MKKPEDLLKPPSLHSFVRMVGSSREKMTKNAVLMYENSPKYSLVAANKIISDRLVLKTDKKTLVRVANSTGRANSRYLVADYIEHFVNYDELMNFSDLKGFKIDIEPFRASAIVKVPVKPNAILVKQGLPQPLVSIGWSTMPFDRDQFRLFMTLLEDAIFTLDEFSQSAGYFVAFPKKKNFSGEMVRGPLEWTRGDFDLLTKNQLKEVFVEYQSAMIDAINIIKAKPNQETAKTVERKKDTQPSDNLDLFRE